MCKNLTVSASSFQKHWFYSNARAEFDLLLPFFTSSYYSYVLYFRLVIERCVVGL